MAVSMTKQLMQALPQLRFQPTPKRIRVRLGDTLVADTVNALLIWEPKRVVPSYAVPESDLLVAAEPADAAPPTGDAARRDIGFGDGPPLLDPSVPFAVHTAPGEALTIAADGRIGEAHRLADPDVAGYVELDFDAFDWWEEDEPIVGHPRDPFHRIDIRQSSRQVRLEHNGVLLADSNRPKMLFEGNFPMPRYYLPPADVRVELTTSELHTTCAYKGHATHYSARLDGALLPDIAWSYEDPLDDATGVAGLICFYQERLDLSVDGEPVERVRTPWS